MTQAERILSKLGGTRAVARLLNIAPSTVQSWKEAGVIPSRRQGDLLAAANREGLDLAPTDFFDMEQLASPGERAA